GEVYQKGKLAKEASYQLLNHTTNEKNDALLLISNQLLEDKDLIIKANKLDLENGREKGLSPSILDRIMLDEKRITDMAIA
ncbi:gamma-glutamyl-phosphate reductase, partial [Pseudomonas sp. SWRI111]|nr:gamma-glutamyl-phosphate reductase [Pseudomonas sp. SWRI111]